MEATKLSIFMAGSFVANPEGSSTWPIEEKLRNEPEKMRRPLPLVELHAKLENTNCLLREMNATTMMEEE